MKRNWDTIRRILLAVEQIQDEEGRVYSNKLPGIDPVEARYHMRLLDEAGFLDAFFHDDDFGWFAFSLTWQGHDLLDQIRDKNP